MIAAISAKIFAYRQLSMNEEAENAENDLKIVMEPIKKQLSLRLDVNDSERVELLTLPSLDYVANAPGLGIVRNFK